MVAVKFSSKRILPGCPAIASDSYVQFQSAKPPVTSSSPDKQRPPSLSMARNASIATIHNEEQIVHHTKHCKADVCFTAHVAKFSTLAPAPSTPSPPPPCNAQQAQHAQRAHLRSNLQRTENATAASVTCNSSSKSFQKQDNSLPDTQKRREVRTADANCHQEVREKLLWWPVDHIQTQHGRLAVGNSCYIITGQCVLCGVDDELDMVECTGCKRFTHFHCTVPKLEKAPVVSLHSSGGNVRNKTWCPASQNALASFTLALLSARSETWTAQSLHHTCLSKSIFDRAPIAP